MNSEEFKRYEKADKRLRDMKDNNPYQSREEEIRDTKYIGYQEEIEEINIDFKLLSAVNIRPTLKEHNHRFPKKGNTEICVQRLVKEKIREEKVRSI